MADEKRNRPGGDGPAPKSSSGGHLHHTDQASLLDHLHDLEEGRRRRDAGMAVARAATHTGWKLHVDRAIEDLAASGRTFTAEDVRAVAGDPLGSGPSSLGAAIGAASRRGLIEPVGFVLATRPEAHARPLRLWQGVSR